VQHFPVSGSLLGMSKPDGARSRPISLNISKRKCLPESSSVGLELKKIQTMWYQAQGRGVMRERITKKDRLDYVAFRKRRYREKYDSSFLYTIFTGLAVNTI